MRIPLTICGIRSQCADFTYSCGFRDSLSLLNIYIIICSWIPQTGFGFHTFCCRFRKIAYFWSNFEHHKVLDICPWNPKQQKISKKKSNVADPTTNLIFACCGIRLQFTNAQFGHAIKFFDCCPMNNRYLHLSNNLFTFFKQKQDCSHFRTTS